MTEQNHGAKHRTASWKAALYERCETSSRDAIDFESVVKIFIAMPREKPVLVAKDDKLPVFGRLADKG